MQNCWAVTIVNLDVVLAQRKMRLNDLAEAVDITPANLSILKTVKKKQSREVES